MVTNWISTYTHRPNNNNVENNNKFIERKWWLSLRFSSLTQKQNTNNLKGPQASMGTSSQYQKGLTAMNLFLHSTFQV